MIKYIGFDLFGTVFNMNNVPKEHLKEYGDVLKDPVWKPFKWYKNWESLAPFENTLHLIDMLKADGFYVLSASNAPLPLVIKLSYKAEISWDGIIPFETKKVYKPKLEAYQFILDLLQCDKSEYLMVSANKGFEQCEKLGIKLATINHDESDYNLIKDIING